MATKLGVILATALLAATPQSVRGQDHAATTNQAVSDNCARSAFRVVVDVGHTLEVPGAMSARGVPEYTFNLQLAREAKQALVDSGFEQTVLLITGTAPWRGLFERAARANAMHADLFISIHHDSVPDNLKQVWEYAGQKNDNIMTTIPATRSSSRTIMPIAPAACYSAACLDTNWSTAAFITHRTTPWH